METVNIPIKSLIIRKEGTRTSVNEQGLKDLTDSISKYGILQPVRVVKNTKKKDTYHVVAGRRRVTAAKAAGLTEVPAIITEGDEQELLLQEVQENINREQLGIVDEIAIVKAFENKTASEVAQILCRPIVWVVTRRRMSKLPQAAIDAVADGRMTVAGLTYLTTMPTDDAATAVEKMVEQGNFRVRASFTDLESAPFDTEDAYLIPEAGPCGSCPFNSSQETLFGREKGTCMKTSCYTEKSEITLAKKIEEQVNAGDVLWFDTSHDSLKNRLSPETVEKGIEFPNWIIGSRTYGTLGKQNEEQIERMQLFLSENPTWAKAVTCSGKVGLVDIEKYHEWKANVDKRAAEREKTEIAESSEPNPQNDIKEEIKALTKKRERAQQIVREKVSQEMREAIEEYLRTADIATYKKMFPSCAIMDMAIEAAIPWHLKNEWGMAQKEITPKEAKRLFMMNAVKTMLGEIDERSQAIFTECLPDVYKLVKDTHQAKADKKIAALDEKIAVLKAELDDIQD